MRQPPAARSIAASVAAVVDAFPGVARRSPDVAYRHPGGRIDGVRIRTDRVEVHLVARWPVRLVELCSAIHDAVRPLTGGRCVHVLVDDLDVEAAGLPTGDNAAPVPVAGHRHAT